MRLRVHTGVAARAMIWGYLLAIGFVMFTLLAVALSIDLSDSLESVAARAEAQGVPVWRVLFPYMGYRSVDIVTRLLPMACLIGAAVNTLLRHRRMEDVILSAAGAGPGLTLGALLVVGVLMGTVQAGFQNWLRPPAVSKQIEMQLGRYGKRYRQTDLQYKWFVKEGRALRGYVVRGAGAEIRDVQLFEGLDKEVLTRIVMAERAKQVTPGLWRFEDVTIWQDGATTRQADLEVAFPLNRARIRWFGVAGLYTPNDALRRIARLAGNKAADEAATTLAFRTVAFFLPGVFALLGTSLAMAGRRGRRFAPMRLMVMAALGYVTLVSVKVFWALGDHGRLDPYAAATIPMGVALGVAVLLQLRQAGYLRRR